MRTRTRRTSAEKSRLTVARPSWRWRMWRHVWVIARFTGRPPLWIAGRVRSLPGALRSVRMRLALWYLAVLAVVILFFGSILYSTTQRNVEGRQQANLTVTSQQLSQRYDKATGVLDVPDLFPGCQTSPNCKQQVQAKQEPYLLGPNDVVVLFDTQGNIVQHLGPITAQGAADVQDIVRLRGNKFGAAQDSLFFSQTITVVDFTGQQTGTDYALYLTTITQNGQNVGVLVVGQPQDGAKLRALLPGLLVAGPLTLLVAALGGYWVASRAMRPVRLITRAAQTIEETDLSRRLHLKRRDELGELAATFDHMLDRLEAAFARQRQFTADASHELRTPLSVVGLEVSRGLAERREPEEYERILAAVRAENEHMSRLVDDLLALARADAGQSQWQMEPLDLSDVALEALERLAPLARERGIELVAGALPELPITGDRLALTRLFVNLIENGVKYTSGPDGRVTLTTGALHQDGIAWAHISDNGPGIAAEHLPHLFERFYRVDAARERLDPSSVDGAETTGGSGLGLAIVRWIAEAHDGSMSVQSTGGPGAVFELRLPLLAGAAG